MPRTAATGCSCWPPGQPTPAPAEPVTTLPTPCARDGKGPGHQRGLPDLLESSGGLLPTPTATTYGSNRCTSPGATRRPSLATLAGELLPTPTAGGGTGHLSGSRRDTWRPTLELAVQGYRPTKVGRPDRTEGPSPSAATPLRTPGESDTGTAGRKGGAGFRPPPSQVALSQVALPLLPTPTVADSRSAANATAGRTQPSAAHTGRTLTDAARLLPTPRATDGTKGCPGQRGSAGDLTLPSAAVRILPTPTGSDGRGPGRHGAGGADLRTAVDDLHAAAPTAIAGAPRDIEPDEARWGVYAAAVARWEHLLGQPVPDPTQPGRHGKPVLAPPFVEWLMGLPPGWVTDLGLPRTVALRVLGNGVVPQQAAYALQQLLCPHRWAPA